MIFSLLIQILLSIGLLVSVSAYAEEIADTGIPVPSDLVTNVEFGYQASSGNSDSDSLNARFSMEHEKGRHRYKGEWKYFVMYKDGIENKRQSTVEAQADYKLEPTNYLYGNFKRMDSKYSAYYVNYTISSGLGYLLSDTKLFTLELELGPGFRYQEPNLSKIGAKDIIYPEVVKEVIGRGNVKAIWQALINLNLSANVTLVSGESSTQTDVDLSATNNITDNVALKLSHNSQHYSWVPEGLRNKDDIFSVNLLFLF